MHPTTELNFANPFADTDESRVSPSQVVAAMEIARAKKRARAAAKKPRVYWEEASHHGSGRQVSLRGALVPVPVARSRRYESTAKLPIPPSSHETEHLALGALVVGVAAVGGWLTYRWWKNRPVKATIVMTHTPTKVHGFVELPSWAY